MTSASRSTSLPGITPFALAGPVLAAGGKDQTGLHLLLAFGLLLLVVAVVGAMRRAWRGRAQQQEENLPALPEPPEQTGNVLAAPLRGRYLGTVDAGHWREWIAARGLAGHDGDYIAVYELGVRVDRDGEAFWIPREAVRGARLERAHAGKVAAPSRLIVVAWSFEGRELEAGFRGEDRARQPKVVRSVHDLIGPAPARPMSGDITSPHALPRPRNRLRPRVPAPARPAEPGAPAAAAPARGQRPDLAAVAPGGPATMPIPVNGRQPRSERAGWRRGGAAASQGAAAETHAGQRGYGADAPGTGASGGYDTAAHGTGALGTGAQDTGAYDIRAHVTGAHSISTDSTGAHGTGAHGTGAHGAGAYDTGSHRAGGYGTGSHRTGAYDTGGYRPGAHDVGAQGSQAVSGGTAGYDTAGYSTAGYDTAGYGTDSYDLRRQGTGGLDARGHATGGYGRPGAPGPAAPDQGALDSAAYHLGAGDAGVHSSGAYNSGAYGSGANDTGAHDSRGYGQGAYDQGRRDPGGRDQGGYDREAYASRGRAGTPPAVGVPGDQGNYWRTGADPAERPRDQGTDAFTAPPGEASYRREEYP
ncbi:conserved hypothetical protein [Parafrankia sp. Ea1.12]|uniref:PH-like domain-containing protein n=1 Tax=Parafrankia sp. Ea1.12 TaxID=573499 RepID=UPI000DA5BDF4|nr:hypothetical protein [Parafrankia sp. Ea1.12]SQD97857.1 conserved hypothetical protein [Parafrankia sp. Ea1.12]